jgi:N-acetylmuramoyl-L-alanine amidase
MHYSKLASREASFKKTGVANGRKYDLTKFTLPVKGEKIQLKGTTVRPSDGYQGYFYPQKFDKKRIVLHFTVGHLHGDISSLSDPNRGHVSTAFVLARDGSTYQLFSSYYWSYHLGRGALGGNGTKSKDSIGIEISNYGPLVKKGANLETVYSRRPGHDVYCSLEDKDQYIELDTPFRGYKYYTAFTDEQYDNLIILLRYLTARYDIPRTFVDENSRHETTLASATMSGIITHVNSRKDKVDIGPAFDWARVIKGVQAPVYPFPEAEARVDEIKTEIEDLKKRLKTLERELVFAEQDADDASAMASRSVDATPESVTIPRGNMVYFSENGFESDNPVPLSRSVGDMGEDGYDEEEDSKADYYIDDEDDYNN